MNNNQNTQKEETQKETPQNEINSTPQGQKGGQAKGQGQEVKENSDQTNTADQKTQG